MAMLTAALASTTLCLGYTYHLEAYKNFPPGGIQYPQFPIYVTTEAAAEAEAAAALASSDIERKFRLHSDKIGEGEGEGVSFYFSASMRRLLLVKDSSVGDFNGTRDI